MSTIISIAETTAQWAQHRQLTAVFTQQTGSTNDDAKKQALHETADWVLYVTGHQTKGRGRGANTWLDTGGGECLLSTWSLRTPQPPQPIAAPRVGLALYQAAIAAWPSLEWSLKAPNDLFLGGHKVAGLLLETVTNGSQHRLLIGLGMNILNHPRSFNSAEHLSKTLAHSLDEGEWFHFLDELRQELETALSELQHTTLQPAICRNLTQALNANSARPFTVREVSPQGDLIHDKGTVKWIDI